MFQNKYIYRLCRITLVVVVLSLSFSSKVFAGHCPPEEPLFCGTGAAGNCYAANCVCLLEPFDGNYAACQGEVNSITDTLFFKYLGFSTQGGIWRWALGVGVGLAVLNVVIGGFQIMTGGMDPAAVTAGKTRIIGAIIGLIFLMFAGVFLNFINPLAFTY